MYGMAGEFLAAPSCLVLTPDGGPVQPLTELYLISPSVSALPIESRLPATEGMLARLLDRDESVRGHIEGTSRYLEWSAKSAKGLARSFGLAL